MRRIYGGHGVVSWGRRVPKREAVSTVAAFALVGCGGGGGGSSGSGGDVTVAPPVVEQIVLGNRQLSPDYEASDSQVSRAYDVMELGTLFDDGLTDAQLGSHLRPAYTTPTGSETKSISYYVNTDTVTTKTVEAIYENVSADTRSGLFSDLTGVNSWDDFANALTTYNDDQVEVVKSIFAHITKFTGITFRNVSAPADATIKIWQVPVSGFSAFAYYPLHGYTDSESNVPSSVFMDTDVIEELTDSGGNARGILIHELGHALGLRHPNTYGADVLAGQTFEVGTGIGCVSTNDSCTTIPDDARYTVMTYSEVSVKHNGVWLFPDKLQALDVYALRTMWTAADVIDDTTHGVNAGDTTHYFGDAYYANPFFTMMDTAGTDTIVLAADPSDESSRSVTNVTQHGAMVDLHGGNFGVRVETRLQDYLAGETVDASELVRPFVPGTVYENITGSDGDDMLIGNSVGNAIDGGDGHDRLYGGIGGVDTLSGGNGDDYILVDFTDTVLTSTAVLPPFIASSDIGDSGAMTWETMYFSSLGTSAIIPTPAFATTTTAEQPFDTIIDGGAGVDQIMLGIGGRFEKTTGGTGADLFYFSTAATTTGTGQASTVDTVTDFDPTEAGDGDRIFLDVQGVSTSANLSNTVADGHTTLSYQLDGSDAVTVAQFTDYAGGDSIHDFVLFA